MTHTQQTIQDAIEGGYESFILEHLLEKSTGGRVITKHDIGAFLLDPLFWQAVGRKREWNNKVVCHKCFQAGFAAEPNCEVCQRSKWLVYWKKFIDHLAEGDDYETALSKL